MEINCLLKRLEVNAAISVGGLLSQKDLKAMQNKFMSGEITIEEALKPEIEI